MTSDVYSILNLVVELWLMAMAVAAFMVHRRLRIPTKATVERVGADEMPPQAIEGLAKRRGELLRAGFKHQFDASCPEAAMTTYLSMYAHPEAHEFAVVMWVAGARGGTSTLEVGTDLDDARSVRTSDAKVVGGLFDEPPGQHVYEFPGLDLTTLLERQRAACERHAGDALPVRVEESELLLCLIRRLSQQSAYYEERGMLRRTEGREYRPTLRGALLFAFRLIPPLPLLRRLTRQRRAATLAR